MSLRFYPVYINHIAESVSAPDLRSLFARVGNVIDVVIVDDYGFVNMETAEDAFRATEELNGRGLHSKLLHVDFSEEMKQVLLSRGTTFRKRRVHHEQGSHGSHQEAIHDLTDFTISKEIVSVA